MDPDDTIPAPPARDTEPAPPPSMTERSLIPTHTSYGDWSGFASEALDEE